MPNPLAFDLRTTLLLPLLSSPGAEEAWRVFFARYWPLLVAWAERSGVGCADAEQIASQVLLKLSSGRTLAAFDRGRGRFRPWLRKVVQRATLDFRRELKRSPGGVGRGGDSEQALDSLLDADSLNELADDLDARLSHDLRQAEFAVQRVRERLKGNTWEAYYRTAILGHSAIEAADALGLSVAAVYMAKQRVTAMLEHEGRNALPF
jgi:DNA-directed RNA polymerase specialized sigma24 family protein